MRTGNEERVRTANCRKFGKVEKGLWIQTDLDLNLYSTSINYRTLGEFSSPVFSSIKQRIILTLRRHCKD